MICTAYRLVPGSALPMVMSMPMGWEMVDAKDFTMSSIIDNLASVPEIAVLTHQHGLVYKS